MQTTLHWKDDSPSGPLSAADFENSVGTIRINATTVPAIVYRAIPFNQYDLAAILATDAHNVFVVYAYCQNGNVTYWYSESLNQTVTPQAASSGTCALNMSPTTSHISLTPYLGPPSDLLPFAMATVDGPALHIGHGSGTATINGQNFGVLPFNWVDC